MNSIANVKSYYSMQQSVLSIDDIILFAKENSIKSVALCDNNMFGAKEFYDKCKKNNIKPIIGLETNMNLSYLLNENKNYIFTLIARNTEGYKELIKISSEVEKNGYIDYSLVAFSDNLYIVSSQSGVIETMYQQQDTNIMKKINQMFNNLYLGFYEGMDSRIIDFSNSCNIKVCYFNPVRSILNKDLKALQIINSKCKINGTEYFNISKNNELTIETEKFLDNCEFYIERENYLPHYNNMNTNESFQCLYSAIKKGLDEKLTPQQRKSQEYISRATNELRVIRDMGLCDYFLIVQDYVKFAKKNNIYVGPGRGSAVGSLVSYALDITEIDPIKYGLMFERFLNKERVSMPDIDVDFEGSRREEIINYIIKKYGEDKVSQIITFNNYGIKVALKDVCDILNVKENYDDIVRYIDTKSDQTLEELYKTSAAFKVSINRCPILKDNLRNIDIISRIPRQISVHPAGVIISSSKINEIVPLSYTNSGTKVTQYSKDYIESTGLLKMDILSLNDLTFNKNVVNRINERNHNFTLNDIDFNDKNTFDILSNGETLGIFQLESKGMVKTLKTIKCNKFDDLIAAIALFRPGPMEYIKTYANRKNGIEEINFEFNELEPILKDTYGIFIYQEQIMKCATDLAGFTLSQADILRKAVSKKDENLMNSMKQMFIKGCELNKHISHNKSEKIFDMIEKFANYGFNKAHAVSYAHIAYSMAYLKANYPLEFYATLISHNINIQKCQEECRKLNIEFINPSINKSNEQCQIYQNKILLSLKGINNVGDKMYTKILDERDNNGIYKNICDFMFRVDPDINVYNSLVDCGAFDEFGYNRTTLRNNYDSLKKFVSNRSLYIMQNDDFTLIDYQDNEKKVSEFEKNALGIYVSFDPSLLIKKKYPDGILTDISKAHTKKELNFIAHIDTIKEFPTKNKQEMMCKMTVSDNTATINVTIFPKKYEQFLKHLFKNNIVEIYGKYENDDKYGESIIVNEIFSPDDRVIDLKDSIKNITDRNEIEMEMI